MTNDVRGGEPQETMTERHAMNGAAPPAPLAPAEPPILATPDPAAPKGPKRVQFNCAKCPGYCCSYPVIVVTKRDIERLAKHFGLVAGGGGEALHQERAWLQAHHAPQGRRAFSEDLPLLRHGEAPLHDLSRRGPPSAAPFPAAAAAAITISSPSSAARQDDPDLSPAPTTADERRRSRARTSPSQLSSCPGL